MYKHIFWENPEDGALQDVRLSRISNDQTNLIRTMRRHIVLYPLTHSIKVPSPQYLHSFTMRHVLNTTYFRPFLAIISSIEFFSYIYFLEICNRHSVFYKH
jgi:hypothetical protein